MDEGIQLEVNTDYEVTPNTNLTDRIEHTIFKKKVYIPKCSYKKFAKYSYVPLGTIIIILLIILITRTTFEPKNSTIEFKIIADAKNKSEVLQYFSYELIISDNNNLWGYDPKSEKIRLLLKVDNFINTFDIHREKMIFWSEINGLEIFSTASQPSNISHKNVNVVFKETRFNPQALAIDFINEKLYAIDKSTGTLIVTDVRTKQYTILSTNLLNPHDIILDSARSFLFIMEQSEGICRMNMDGTNYQLIVSLSDVSGITIDLKNQRLYWVESSLMIMSSNYDGKTRTRILEESANTILSLAYFDDQLFWLWSDSNQNDTTLQSCTIENKTCVAHYVHLLTFSNATIIQAFSHSKEIMKDVSNACMRRNGGCQQMCVLTFHKNGGRSCACYSGWELKSDLKSCQPINDQFILHARKNVIRGFSVNRMETKLTNSILPIWFNTKSLIYKSSLEITYNAKSDYFFASDDTYIYNVSLKGLSKQTIICNITGQYYVNNIAFDWHTKKLFYIKRSVLSENVHSIMIYDTKRCNDSYQTLYSFSYSEDSYLDGCPHALIIHPQGEYFFYCVEQFEIYNYLNKVAVYQVNINSTNQTAYFHGDRNAGSFVPNALAIESETNDLWWLYTESSGYYNSYQYTLQTINSHPNARKITLDRKVNMLYFYSKWLYFSSESNIYRLLEPISYGDYNNMQDLSVITMVSLP